jgi:NAD(P)-dependent dehydrogenase (short-subunit alcohol dehydrogenase family)
MNKHMKIVVIGGSGLIGTKLVNNLRQHGQEVVAASPSSGVNTITGEGQAKALTGAQVVADVRTRLLGKTRPFWSSSKPPGVISWPRSPPALIRASARLFSRTGSSMPRAQQAT